MSEPYLQITVIIPVYNAEAFVEQAVGSALEQAEVVEVLLVEDGSTDGSLAKCEALAAESERVQLLRHPNGENRGAAETRNVGVREATQDWVAFLDADDYYLPGRFQAVANVLAEHPDADGIYDAVGTHFESDEMRQWWADRGRGELSTVRKRVAPDELFEAITGNLGSFHTNGIVVRREFFERTGMFDAELRMAQDFALWIKMAAIGKLYPGAIDRAVAMRRLHGDNRIVQQRSEHRKYGLLMWQVLSRWAAQQKLSAYYRQKLAMGQFHAWKQMTAAERGECMGFSGDLRFLGRLAQEHPVCLQSRRFWKHTARAMGGSRLRAMLRPPAKAEATNQA
ncbi:MAG: glycosyltransferase family 2 protein [Phycisphaeraceae bacterium]